MKAFLSLCLGQKKIGHHRRYNTDTQRHLWGRKIILTLFITSALSWGLSLIFLTISFCFWTSSLTLTCIQVSWKVSVGWRIRGWRRDDEQEREGSWKREIKAFVSRFTWLFSLNRCCFSCHWCLKKMKKTRLGCCSGFKTILLWREMKIHSLDSWLEGVIFVWQNSQDMPA